MAWSISNAMMKAYESSNCSQVQAVASSAASCSDTKLSAPSSTTPMPDQFYWPDKTTEHSRLSRFGMTCEPLTEGRGEALLTWFRAGFLARTSVLRVKGLASKASEAGYGVKWHGSFARFNRDTSAWKTVQCSLLGDSESYLETWPRWGSMQDGVSFRQQIPALPICASESGFWPMTPVRLWPTPSAGNDKWNGSIQEWGGSWNWVRQEDPEFARGPLNPEWVEWLMGWPIGWTGLNPLGMGKFHEWQRQHGGF